MEKSSKRGKIPQQDWPSIIKRYEAGETLASIARTYDCSPPAISYIVSRSRARDSTAESTAPAATEPSEPRLVKGKASEMAGAEVFAGEPQVNGASSNNLEAEVSDPEQLPSEPQQVQPGHASNETEDALNSRKAAVMGQGNGPVERYDQGQRDTNPAGNGSPLRSFGSVGMSPQNGEPRRTLHLSLSQGGNQRSDAQYHDESAGNPPGSGERIPIRPSGGPQEEFVQPVRNAPVDFAPATSAGAAHMTIEPQRAREGSAYIDRVLRERVDGDITAFLAAFDAALAHDTIESRTGLREATDRLLRAGARTRIELERLEARVPLPPRENSGQAASAWRSR